MYINTFSLGVEGLSKRNIKYSKSLIHKSPAEHSLEL